MTTAVRTTPEEDLKAKQTQLESKQGEIALATRTAEQLRVDIKALQGKITESVQVLAGYEKSQNELGHDLEDADQYIARKDPVADAGLGSKKARVDEEIAKFDRVLDAKRAAVSTAWEAFKTANERVAPAEKKALDSEDAYKLTKDLPKESGGELKELQTLFTQVDAAEKARDFVIMYFLLKESAVLRKNIDNPDPAEYEADLKKALTAAETDREHAVAAKVAADDLHRKYKAAKQIYEAAEKSRRADLLSTLKALW